MVWGLQFPTFFERLISPFRLIYGIYSARYRFVILHVTVLSFDQFLPYLAQIFIPFLSTTDHCGLAWA
jgi:hypothetical protein